MFLSIGISLFILVLVSKVWRTLKREPLDAKGKHIFITGGSTGLGLALALKYALAGAKISIVSRSKTNLEDAKKKIEEAGATSVFIQPTDVTDYEQVTSAINAANQHHQQTTDHVFCCAGFAYPGYFAEQDVNVFRKQMDLNYFGSLHAAKAALPAMIARGTGGRITFISSGCGFIGFIGYSQYCASKYALRGLADALRNELQLYNISVAVFYPGNMQTPGFENEEKMKPPETKEIEGASAIVDPNTAAQHLIDGLCAGEYAITNALEVYLLKALNNGIAPRSNTIMDMVLLPIFVAIQYFYCFYMDYVVQKSKKCCKTKKD